MKENGKISGAYSWPVVILALIFFWPVGLFLLIKRVSMDPKASVGQLLGIVGGISYGFVFVGLMASLTDGFDYSDVALMLFFFITGFILRRIGKKKKIEEENVKLYLPIIVNGNIRQLDSIAATTGKSYDVVKADIQKMITKGQLKGAYIDESRREVVLTTAAPDSIVDDPIQHAATSAELQAKVVVCPCCGASNTIHGTTGECEYCGSPIK